jgi:flagellar biogenesis protein FliO
VTWSFWASYLAKLAVVGLMLAVLYAVARALRHTRFFALRSRRVRVLESLMLSQHCAIHLVRVDTRCFLLGSGTAGVTRLAEIRKSSDSEPTSSYTLK